MNRQKISLVGATQAAFNTLMLTNSKSAFLKAITTSTPSKKERQMLEFVAEAYKTAALYVAIQVVIERSKWKGKLTADAFVFDQYCMRRILKFGVKKIPAKETKAIMKDIWQTFDNAPVIVEKKKYLLRGNDDSKVKNWRKLAQNKAVRRFRAMHSKESKVKRLADSILLELSKTGF